MVFGEELCPVFWVLSSWDHWISSSCGHSWKGGSKSWDSLVKTFCGRKPELRKLSRVCSGLWTSHCCFSGSRLLCRWPHRVILIGSVFLSHAPSTNKLSWAPYVANDTALPVMLARSQPLGCHPCPHRSQHPWLCTFPWTHFVTLAVAPGPQTRVAMKPQRQLVSSSHPSLPAN